MEETGNQKKRKFSRIDDNNGHNDDITLEQQENIHPHDNRYKRGRQVGAVNYRDQLVYHVVRELRPKVPADWIAVAQLYHKESQENELRQWKSLKDHWFRRIVRNDSHPLHHKAASLQNRIDDENKNQLLSPVPKEIRFSSFEDYVVGEDIISAVSEEPATLVDDTEEEEELDDEEEDEQFELDALQSMANLIFLATITFSVISQRQSIDTLLFRSSLPSYTKDQLRGIRDQQDHTMTCIGVFAQSIGDQLKAKYDL